MSVGFYHQYPLYNFQAMIKLNVVTHVCLTAKTTSLTPTHSLHHSHIHNRNTSPQEPTTRDILEGCKSLAPELLNAHGEFDILAVQVGLRPSRNGGPRVEVEIVEGGYKVVHSYGHGGAGYVLYSSHFLCSGGEGGFARRWRGTTSVGMVGW